MRVCVSLKGVPVTRKHVLGMNGATTPRRVFGKYGLKLFGRNQFWVQMCRFTMVVNRLTFDANNHKAIERPSPLVADVVGSCAGGNGFVLDGGGGGAGVKEKEEEEEEEEEEEGEEEEEKPLLEARARLRRRALKNLSI